MKPYFFSAQTELAKQARDALAKKYGDTSLEQADIVVAVGGDGCMLRALHDSVSHKKPVFGLNRGSVGFLLNEFNEEGLIERLKKAVPVKIHPLRVRVTAAGGKTLEALAINDVALLRETRQAAKITISVDGQVRLPELIADGVLIATPAGSTAYNFSVHGPIIPLSSELMALTPISPFRPRRWRGALLPQTSKVMFDIISPKERPVSAVADFTEFRDVEKVEVWRDKSIEISLLFDPHSNLEERIIKEQFVP